ncbi:MAG TPA: hypothetical protein VHG93_23215 [Longimicrobium sp.]|nr:hypothetical protein [Longimicrobium sp.]
MRMVIRFGVLACLLASLHPAALAAQQGALSLQNVEYLLSQGVSSQRVLQVASARCIAFRTDRAALERLRAAGADEALLRALPRVCSTAAPPVPEPEPVRVVPFDPGTAALQSLLVPGWGQFETGRSGAGLFFGTAGLVALGVALYEESPDPADPSYTETPYATAGLAAYAGIAVLAALDAYQGADAANARAASRRVQVVSKVAPAAGGGVEVDLVRIAF